MPRWSVKPRPSLVIFSGWTLFVRTRMAFSRGEACVAPTNRDLPYIVNSKSHRDLTREN